MYHDYDYYMKPFIWYARPSGENIQYGLRTGIKGFDFSIYLNHPATKNVEVGFASFQGKSIYEENTWERTEMDSYLNLLLCRKFGKRIIKEAFGEQTYDR